MKKPGKHLIAVLTGEGYRSEIWLTVGKDGSEHVNFRGDADINADGSPHAYHPADKGTDFLANAKDQNGKLVGVLTDSHGQPFIQKLNDIAPGYFVSCTAYHWMGVDRTRQAAYVDGEKIPGITVPPVIISETDGAVLGCLAIATYFDAQGNVIGRAEGMVNDRGPRTKDGEVSPCMARLIGLDSSPKHGGTDLPRVEYDIFPGKFATVDGRLIPLLKSDGDYIVPPVS